MIPTEESPLYNEVYQRWTYALQNCRSIHEMASKCYRLWQSWAHKNTYGYADNCDPAIGYRIIETMHAYMRCNVLDPGIYAVAEEDADKASVMNDLVKADYSTADFQKSMDNYYLNMLVGGTGVLKLGWSFAEKPFWRWVKDDEELVKLCQETLGLLIASKPDDEITIQFKTILDSGDINLLKDFLNTRAVNNILPESGNTGYKVRDIAQFDAPYAEIIPINDMAWLGCGQTIRECDSVFRRFYVTRQQILAWQAQGGDWQNLDAVLGTCSEFYGNTTSTSQEIDISNGRNVLPGQMIELIEESRRDPRTGQIWETIIHVESSSVVRHRPMPYFHNELPYFSIRVFGNLSDFAGVSVLVPTESLIGAYIKVCNEILENGQLSINKVFMTRIGRQNTPPQMHFFPGNLIAVENYDDVRPLDIPDLRPSSLALLDKIKTEIEEITGCPAALNAAHGDTSGGNAGNVEQLQFYQTARFAATQHQIAVELSAMTMQIVKLHQQYDYQGRTVYVNDGGKGSRWVQYDPTDYAGQFAANSDPRSMLPTNNAVKRAQLTAAYNLVTRAKVAAIDDKTGQPISELILNPEELTRELIASFDMLDNKKLFNRHGDVTCLDPNALPPLPTPPQEQQEQAKVETDENAIAPEDMEKLQAVADQMGIPIGKIIQQGKAILEGAKEGASAPMEVQGGAVVPQNVAQAINAQTIDGLGGGGGGDTLSGTNGMPPIMGGSQQAGSMVSEQNVANPSTASDAMQSALTIQ